MLESLRAQPLLSNTERLENGLFIPPCLHTHLQTLAASVLPWAATSLTRRTARKRRQTSSRTSTKTSWWSSSRKQETWRRWREPGASSRCTRILRASPKRSWLFSRTRRTNWCSLPDWRSSRWSFVEESFRWKAVQMCYRERNACWSLVFLKALCWTCGGVLSESCWRAVKIQREETELIRSKKIEL